jgi:hypothetical protein
MPSAALLHCALIWRGDQNGINILVPDRILVDNKGGGFVSRSA